jgi:hypothetical protein
MVSGSYSMSLEVARRQEGDELTLEVLRTNPAAAPLTDVSTVLLRVTPQDVEAGSTPVEANLVGALEADRGRWEARGAILPLDGQYVVNVTVRRTVANDLRGAFSVGVVTGQRPSLSPTTALQVRVGTEPSPPVSGTVTLRLTILDGEGVAIEGARVSVVARRPASQDPPVVAAAAPVADSAGVYEAALELRATGSWLLLFSVEKDGVLLRSDASIDVGE